MKTKPTPNQLHGIVTNRALIGRVIPGRELEQRNREAKR